MKPSRVAIVGSGLLSEAVSQLLSAAPETFAAPTQLPDAAALADPAAVDAALSGADAAFVELPADPGDAGCLARVPGLVGALARSALTHGVGHVICCTSASPLKVTGASARRLDAWAEAEAAWRRSGLNVTFLMLPVFYQELLHRLRLRRIDGHACIGIPCGGAPFDMMDCDDAARVVVSCLQLGNRCYGRCLPLSAGKMTVQQVAEALSGELGVRVLDQKVSCEQLRARGDPASVDIANEFEFVTRFDQQLKRPVAEQYLPRIASFPEWCAANRDRLMKLLDDDC